MEEKLVKGLETSLLLNVIIQHSGNSRVVGSVLSAKDPKYMYGMIYEGGFCAISGPFSSVVSRVIHRKTGKLIPEQRRGDKLKNSKDMIDVCCELLRKNEIDKGTLRP